MLAGCGLQKQPTRDLLLAASTARRSRPRGSVCQLRENGSADKCSIIERLPSLPILLGSCRRVQSRRRLNPEFPAHIWSSESHPHRIDVPELINNGTPPHCQKAIVSENSRGTRIRRNIAADLYKNGPHCGNRSAIEFVVHRTLQNDLFQTNLICANPTFQSARRLKKNILWAGTNWACTDGKRCWVKPLNCPSRPDAMQV
jgi:hypothetical protein